MAKYKVTFKNSVAKDLQSIPANDITKILSKIDALAQDPRGEGCIKLSDKQFYQVRQGIYRFVYEIRDEMLIINVIKVAHRSQVHQSF